MPKERVISADVAEEILSKRYKELTFIRCSGSCTLFQFNDAILTIRPADDGFSMEYLLIAR